MQVEERTTKVEGTTTTTQKKFFPFSKPSPFSSMTEAGRSGQPINDEALHRNKSQNDRTMSETSATLKKVHEEFAKFQTTMQELYLLKRVANDLKSYRKMIRVKQYD